MALEKELDGRLLTEFARAQERTQKGKLAIGVPDAPQDEKIGFMPRAIRMGKSLIAEQELSELDQTFKDYMNEYSRTANFKDIQTRNRSSIEMKQRFGKLRDTLFTQGLAFQKKVALEKLDAKSEAFMWGEYGKVVEGLGKAWVLHGLKTPGVEDDMVGATRKISPGPSTRYDESGQGFHGMTLKDWQGMKEDELISRPMDATPSLPGQSGWDKLLDDLGMEWFRHS